MPLLDSMIYLRDSSSPQDYDQSIFRLCTRNTKSIVDPEEGMQKKINMKENVYLIDFNITNMMNMIANSAKMKAAVDGDASAERISKYIEDDISTTSIFAEKGDEIGVKMHKMSVNDMLEIYAKYNSNKSIADIANDDINIFIGLFSDKTFQQMVSKFNVKADNSVNVIGIDDTVATTDISLAGMTDKKQMQSLKDTIKTALSGMSKEERKQYEETQKKFKRIVKMLLYCNLCLDKPYTDMENIIKGAAANTEFVKMLKSFNIDISDLKSIYNYMSVAYKQLFNQMLLKIALLANDASKGNYEKFMTGVAGLGRIEKNEVITPKKIVEKMIAKLPDSAYKNAKSILLVNEKQGEFFVELCKKLGNKAAAEKCKIVASSETTKYLIIKLLKTMGMSEYINTILVDIDDHDGNGKYDVNDFLKMSNNDILKMNGGKKFDVVLMNPPYAQSSDNLHLKFVDKVLEISKTQISIFPLTFVTKRNIKSQDFYKEKWNDNIVSVDEIESGLFTGTSMPNCGIYVFDSKPTKDIIVNFLNNSKSVSSIFAISDFDDYEKNIFMYLENHGQQPIKSGPYHKKRKTITGSDIELQVYNETLKNAEKRIPKNKIYLICNSVNGGMNGTFFSSKVGQIIDNFNDLIDYFASTDVGNAHNVMFFDSIKAAENCKIAMSNPLLRLTCYRTQDYQRMIADKVYKYVPNINWEDPRVTTDEGLLEVCGCPKDKCKEYADYCKKVIEEVDKKKK